MRRSIALIGTGGSSGATLQDLEEPLRQQFGDVDFVFIDTQPFNLRTGGTTRYAGAGTVRTASIRDAGMIPFTKSWSTNMLLNGGPVMTRRLMRYASSLLEKRQDAMLICHDRLYLEQAFVRAAQAMGTPSILIQEGPFVHVGPRNARSAKLRVKRALAPLLSKTAILPPIVDYGFAGHDRFIVPSQDYRSRWIAAGLPEEMIDVAGVVRYDHMWKAVREAESVTSDGPLRLLYLFQPFGEHGKVDPAVAGRIQLAMIDGIVRAAQTVPLHLTIRIHPRSKVESVSHLVERLAISHDVDPCSVRIEKAISRSDLVIGHYSSGLLEAMMLKRPVLCVPVPEHAFAEDSEASKQGWMATTGALLGDDADGVADAICGLDRNAPPLVPHLVYEKEVGTVDGQAGSRCARFIGDVIERQS